MSYTFELSFSGLCIFTFGGTDLGNPTEVNVLLVKARSGSGRGPDDHLPYLTYRAHDVYGPIPKHELLPNVDGAQLARLDLTGETGLHLELPAGGTWPLQAVWRDQTKFKTLPQAPSLTDRTQETWLDWVIALQRVNPETMSPTPNTPPGNGLSLVTSSGASLVTSVVNLKRGVLRAGALQRATAIDAGTHLHEHLVYDFKSGTHIIPGYAMAGSVVLSIANLATSDAVTIKGTRTTDPINLKLRAPLRADDTSEPVIYASITNLPAAESVPMTMLHHFKHFYDLTSFAKTPPSPLRLPAATGVAITSTGVFCPPVTHIVAS